MLSSVKVFEGVTFTDANVKCHLLNVLMKKGYASNFETAITHRQAKQQLHFTYQVLEVIVIEEPS